MCNLQNFNTSSISDEMKLEIESGVNFISHVLRLGSERKISERKLKQFSKCLYQILLKRYEEFWYPERPYKYSGYRILRINRNIDPMIRLAGEWCELSLKLLDESLPNLEIWIDPSEVTCRFGSDSELMLLYKPGDNEPWRPQTLEKQFCTCCLL